MTNQASFHEGQLTVSQVMSGQPVTVDVGTTLFQVAKIFADKSFRHVLVKDNQGGIVGVVSSTDLFREMSSPNKSEADNWKTRPVEAVMTSRFVASTPNADAEDVARVVATSNMNCVPVIEDGRLIGVLTPDDFLMSWNKIDPVLKEATIDPVSNLANRATFDFRLVEEWNRASRQDVPMGVILFDVDYFKQINDLCGHPTGDSVLNMIGSCLERHVRVYDIAARYGGDEFAALCYGCNHNDIAIPIERIQKALRNLNIPAEVGRRAITLSIGAAVVEGTYGDLTPDDLISAADASLYQAKRNGRDCAYRTRVCANRSFTPVLMESSEELAAV